MRWAANDVCIACNIQGFAQNRSFPTVHGSVLTLTSESLAAENGRGRFKYLFASSPDQASNPIRVSGRGNTVCMLGNPCTNASKTGRGIPDCATPKIFPELAENSGRVPGGECE